MSNQAVMAVKLIDYAAMPLEKLYAAFRTCYSSDTPIEIWEKIRTEKISHDKIRQFINERLKTGHASPLEQVVFWFGISNVSRSLSHQFVRHRIGISFEQQSQRYVKFKEDKLSYVIPESWNRAGLGEDYAELTAKISALYARALAAGVPAEDARFVLPNAAPTNFQVMVNFAEMLHICDLRLVRAGAVGNPADGRPDALRDQKDSARGRRLPAAQVRREPDGLLRRIAGGLAQVPAGQGQTAQKRALRAVQFIWQPEGSGPDGERISRSRGKRTALSDPAAPAENEMVSDSNGSSAAIPPELKDAIRSFNRGDYFAASEQFETVGHAADESLKDVIGALHRVAAGLHLRFARGGRQSTINLLSQAMMSLDELRPARAGIDVERLFKELGRSPTICAPAPKSSKPDRSSTRRACSWNAAAPPESS